LDGDVVVTITLSPRLKEASGFELSSGFDFKVAVDLAT
jgi:hypothetical protein